MGIEDPPEILDAIITFLGSLRFSPPGGLWRFHAGPKTFGFGGFGLELYIDVKRQNTAVLKLLRSSLGGRLDGTIQQAAKVLKSFFIKEIDQLGGGNLMLSAVSNPRLTVLQCVSQEKVVSFAASFSGYLDEYFQECLYLIPMTGLPCVEEVNEPNFVWWSGNKDLGDLSDRFNFLRGQIVSGQFPPMDENYRLTILQEKDSWLGCFALHDTSGKAMLRRVAGALFLGLELKNSLLISGAKQPKGLFVLKPGKYSFSTVSSPLPHLIQPVIVEPSVVSFVREVLKTAVDNKRLSVALECCGAAWKHSERDRFMQLCVAFDALFGIQGKVAASIKQGVQKHAKNVIDTEGRCHLLLRMRNNLLHGEAFALAQCKDYLEYNDRFSVSPERDQISLLRACVWDMAVGPK